MPRNFIDQIHQRLKDSQRHRRNGQLQRDAQTVQDPRVEDEAADESDHQRAHRVDAVVLTIALMCTKNFDYEALTLRELRDKRGVDLDRFRRRPRS